MRNHSLAIGIRTAAILLIAGGAAAEEKTRASGHFNSRNWKVPISDAYAFHDKAMLGDDRVVLVAVSNYNFGTDFLDHTYYRQHMIDNYFVDQETRVVYLEFGLDGKYRGYNYYFESGDGCGYCGGGDFQSTVKLKDGRVQGKVGLKDSDDPERGFDITLDVPIAPDDYGRKQGPGGGEPGKALVAYHSALATYEDTAIRGQLSEGQLERWDKAAKDGKGDAFKQYLTKDRPQTARVSEAFVAGNRALALMDGDSEVLGKMHGEAQLVLEGGVWKVDDETWQLGGS